MVGRRAPTVDLQQRTRILVDKERSHRRNSAAQLNEQRVVALVVRKSRGHRLEDTFFLVALEKLRSEVTAGGRWIESKKNHSQTASSQGKDKVGVVIASSRHENECMMGYMGSPDRSQRHVQARPSRSWWADRLPRLHAARVTTVSFVGDGRPFPLAVADAIP